jgi:hypothetical protein
MRLLAVALLGWSILVATSQGYCGDLGAPFSLDSSAVLPKGIRNVRLTTLTTAVDNQYNAQGNVQPLGASINKAITFKRLTGSVDNLSERAALEGTIEGMGYSLEDEAGHTFGEVNTRVTATVPVLAYGITKDFMMAVAVPVVYSNLNVSTGWIASSGTNAVVDDLVNGGAKEEIRARQAQLENVVASEFVKKGYVAPHDQEKQQVGDVMLVMKKRLYESPRFATAVQGKIVTPTGHRANVNDISDVGAGDGQWDFGVGFVVDHYIDAHWTLTSSTSYLNQTATEVAMRIPQSSDESLTPDVDEETYMNLGDSFGQSLAAKYKLNEMISLGTSGGIQYKSPDNYSGSKFSGERYDYLEADSEQYMVTATALASFNTIEMFKRGAFAVPFEVNVSASQVLTGRNVNANTLGAAELCLFF